MRYALLIGNGHYQDPQLENLRSPNLDVRRLERVLRDLGSFDQIEPLVDVDEGEIRRKLEDAFAERRRDDLVLVYFSGHGKMDHRGRLYFAAHTTRTNRLESTAVPVDILHKHLEDTRAGSKVVLLDCCYSGSFAKGFTGRGDEHEAISQQVPSRGSYVITASGRGERAFEPDNAGSADDEVGLSVFTRALCDGLSGAAPDLDGNGWIDAAELDRYLKDEIHKVADQTPTSFTEEVQGTLALTRASVNAQPVVSQGSTQAADGETSTRHSERDTPESQLAAPAARHEPAGGLQAPLDSNGWRRLLNYYADCVEREAVLSELVSVESASKFYTTRLGITEHLLTGDVSELPVEGEALEIARAAESQGSQLRYGFPAVVVPTQRREARDRWRVAPLLVADLALDDSSGRPCLRLTGEVELNWGLIREVSAVSGAELEDLETWFEADWERGDASQLGTKVRSLLGMLDIRSVSTIAPGELATDLVSRPIRAGARNAAMLYFVGAANANTGLLKDLRGTKSAMEATEIPGTALGVLDSRTDAAVATDERPFDVVAAGQLNESQERVLRAAMTQRLTVATGPPGTGKSQLVTSLVASAVTAGQTVLVASTNNSAVDVVVERANQLVPDLVIRTGNKEHRSQEPDTLRRLLRQANGKPDTATPRTRVRTWQHEVDTARTSLNRRAELERELARVTAQRHYWADQLGWKLEELPAALVGERGLRRWSRRVRWAIRLGRFGFWHRARLRAVLGTPTNDDSLHALQRLLDSEMAWWQSRQQEESVPAATETWHTLGAATGKHREHSSAYLQACATAAWSTGRDDIQKRIEALTDDKSSWSRFSSVLRHVRTWATTAQSVRTIPPQAGLFDLVIVDEASQCSIPAVLPLLYRARRALVIGDPNQLQHITMLPPEQDATYRRRAELNEDWMNERRLVCHEYSAYHAFEMAAGEALWLDEHYRCHPEIIEISNRHFYGDRLAVLTDPTRLAVREERPVSWVDVAGEAQRPQAGSCRNDAEARQVCDLVRDLDARLPEDAAIGVITPFAGQRTLIRKLLEEAGLDDRARVGTIHTFQGDECDVVVLSLVASPEIQRGTLRWLLSQANLWNVAITRARCALYAVGHREFWSRQRGPLRELLRIADDEPELAGPQQGDADAKQRLYRALELAGVDFRAAPLFEGYHCDAVLDTPDGPVVVLIDQAGAGGERDEEAGRAARQLLGRCDVLQQAGATRAVRVATWRCIDEPDQVVTELLKQSSALR